LPEPAFSASIARFLVPLQSHFYSRNRRGQQSGTRSGESVTTTRPLFLISHFFAYKDRKNHLAALHPDARQHATDAATGIKMHRLQCVAAPAFKTAPPRKNLRAAI
jgi:hypothetical protein